MNTIAPATPSGMAFRPWGIDTLAEVIRRDREGGITVRYDHDPARTYYLPKKDHMLIGRIVRRDDFR